MRASFWGLLGARSVFSVTAKGQGSRVRYRDLWPQLLLWGINLVALTWGLNRLVHEPTGAVVMNIAWVAYHFLLLSSVFYFAEEDIWERIGLKKLSKNVSFEYRIVANKAEEIPADQLARRNGFWIDLPEVFTPGSVLMLKLRLPGEKPLVFDGKVLWVAGSKKGRKVPTVVAAETITEDDRHILERNLSK